jgi:hypothetical protein
MKRKGKLKNFQWDTVEAVLNQLEGKSVYSLADEVGLGKTLVLTEVMLQTYLKLKRKPKRYFVFYVAPSHELISQNLHGISKYLKSRLDEEKIPNINVIAYNSRLTKLIIDSSKAEHRSDKSQRFIHLVGLSQETSFKVNGKGALAERCFLAHLFGHGRKIENREFLYDFFWALDRERDPEQFERQYIYKNGHILGPRVGEIASHLRKDPILNQEIQNILSYSLRDWRNNPEYGKILGRIRKRVIDLLVFGGGSAVGCNFLILDEWHKYSDLCLSKKERLNRLINYSRIENKIKTLLVSATPFKVDYDGEVKKESKKKLTVRGSYFEDLFRLVYGEEYHKYFSEFNDSRTLFLKSVTDFISEYASEDSEKTSEFYDSAVQNRDRYIDCLIQITVRTERPKKFEGDEDRLINELSENVSWKENKNSFREYLKNILKYKSKQKNEPTRSPISQMYLDGRTFSEFHDYDIKGPRLKEENWKSQALNNHIREKISTWPFSINLPPLWINPRLEIDKALIFTEFRFAPPEICEALTSEDPFAGEVKRSGTIFGNFPVKDKKVKESRSKSSFHWPYFYVPIFAEDASWEPIKKATFDSILEDSGSIRSAIYKLERNIIGGCAEKLERLKIRFENIEGDEYDPKRKEARELLWRIFGRKSCFTLGKCFSEIIGRKFDYIPVNKEVEKNILLISYWFLRTFVSDNSQRIYEEIRVRRGSDKMFDPANVHLDFVSWYCKRYEFHKTFSEYLELLNKGYSSPEDAFKEFYLSMALKANRTFGKHYRPFLDSKDSDAKTNDGEGYSQRTIRNAFNSPFPPYVLVSTSVGQEGLDFHRYCKTIIHWSPPYSPSVLQQREGRIDRYMSQQVREAINAYNIDENHELLDGIHPHFTVVDSKGRRLNAPERFVLFLPFSSQARTWKRCLARMYYSDLLIGHPDPLAIDNEIRTKIEQIDKDRKSELYQLLQDLFVTLRPRKTSIKKVA